MKCPYCTKEVIPNDLNCPKCKAEIVKKQTKQIPAEPEKEVKE